MPGYTIGQKILGAPPIADRALLRAGAVLGLVGLVVQVVATSLHPGHVNPNNSAAVFLEYAQSSIWTAVHIGQFIGTLLFVLALLTIARSLAADGGLPGVLALIAANVLVLVAAVFAVQMAVDGVALKATIDWWIAAPTATDKASAFQVAMSVRSIEKGLSGFFHILNGTALVSLGLSIAFGGVYSRWLGWIGAAAGVAFVVGGIVTAHTGFSPTAGTILTGFALPGFAVFLLGMCASMWRRSSRPASELDVASHPVAAR